jgi:indole-3-glycerol phosphate synthase
MINVMSDILQEIIAYKREFVAISKAKLPYSEVVAQAKQMQAKPNFVRALSAKIADEKPALIAEIKKASPSKGLIRADFDAVKIATDYAQGGAACLSILTDEKYFLGRNQYVQEVRANCALPILRKDFMIDEYQIAEAKAIGADCVLLIMAALSDAQAVELENAAFEHRLDVLVEVHDHLELERALKYLQTPLFGINNRNLKTMQVDLQTTINLSKYIPKGKIVVCESGIKTSNDVRNMQRHGINCFLVGESLMLQDDIMSATTILLG